MNPPELVADVAQELVAQGARAVVLMGSHARSDAVAESDIDIIAIGDGEPYRLERRGGHLLSISWVSDAAVRESFRTPRDAPGVVPGWRSARLLIDEVGIAAALQEQARAWSWDDIETGASDAYVAEEITGLAEEVHKLVNLRTTGNLTGAAVQRAILSFRLGAIMAIHLRLTFDTENRLWNIVDERLGGPWCSAQARAFGLGDESFDETCRAVLELYRLAADALRPLLDERQLAVVRHACDLSIQVV